MKKITVFLCIFLIIVFLCVHSYAKYTIDNTMKVANINIDGEIPKVEFLNVINSNENDNKYANKTHTIIIELRIKERNIKENNLDKNLVFLLDDKKVIPGSRVIEKDKQVGEYTNYKIRISKIKGDGKLKIKVNEGAVIDIANQINEEAFLDTKIQIDNTSPIISFYQQKMEDGKIKAVIKANEKIKEVNGWDLSEDGMELSKNFSCNVLYPFIVTDLVGNTTQIDVKIDKATKIRIRYGSTSESPMNNWQFGTGLNEIVGKNAIQENNKLKIEAISMYWEGIDKDFIQIRCFLNTYWGEGIEGSCYTYGTRYNYGYNPSDNKYATLTNGKIINLDGKLTLILGGAGMNKEGNRGFGGEAIPENVANNHNFGVTALSIKLKDNAEDSVVYQVWVEGEGWLEPVSDGEETTFKHDKPIGAYRMSLIPKTEKQYLIDSWKKDVGTNNMK